MQDGQQKLRNAIDFSHLVPCTHIIGDDPEDTRLLNAHRKHAEDWLASFSWCKGVKECYFGGGLGGILAIFLMRIEPRSQDQEIDEHVWVIVGDVPPAYLVTDDAPMPSKALEVYCQLMQDWVDAVHAGSSVSDLIPVSAAPTIENADALQTRLITLQRLEICERPELLWAKGPEN